ncbi:MAG: ABC transporter permease subunit [Thermoguttaceae bacterium]|nr:ABC transporter permease subunit [Thermoguttaceae bacterium]MBQ7109595.1 ABC transporter permease subunit [Thermoguttaceae bacterium]
MTSVVSALSSISTSAPPLFGVPAWLKASSQIDVAALVVVAIFLVVVALIRFAAPKCGAIAWVTAKETLLQPLFLILTLFGLFGLFIFPFLPYHTLGEDVKIVVSQGLTLVKLVCVFLAIWTASSSIADEIEGKTALMILAKPVGRQRFVFGKYLGVMIAVTALFLILGIFFMNTVAYKLVYDARESAKELPTAIECYQYVAKMAPGLCLAYFETVVLTAISIAISTRLPLLPNLTICLTIYALGHVVPTLVVSNVGETMPIVGFFANLICAVTPILEHFNMETAIAMDQPVPWDYVATAGVYSLLFAAVAMLLSLLLFEDRDLA